MRGARTPGAGRMVSPLRRVRLELVLAAAVAANVALEVAKGSEPVGTAPIWTALQSGIAALALAVAFVRRGELRLPSVLALGLLFALGSIFAHLALGVDSDWDSREIYTPQGETLLSGRYPLSEYPPGAVVLFAFETLIGGGSARVSNAFVMVLFQLLTVFAIWELRTRWAPWLATFVALWPLNAFHWEFKFDSVPAGLTALGLLLAFRGRWTLAGALLGAGAAVKWTPGLAALGLALWLLASGGRIQAVRHGAAAATTFLAVHLPFLIANAPAVMHAYTTQGGRGITGESLYYVPLRALGLAELPRAIWFAADVPGWANPAAIGLQAAGLLSLLGAIILVRGNRNAGIVLAAMLPVVFLLTNRIFSPQFIVPLFVSWALAAALLERNARGVAVVSLLAMTASFCNAIVYPGLSGSWLLFSAGLFAAALAATGWLIARAIRCRRLPSTAWAAARLSASPARRRGEPAA